jgi:hypothetical protein
MKKLLILLLVLTVTGPVGAPCTRSNAEPIVPFLERNSEPGKIIVVPPEELREWVKKTEKWAYEAQLQAIRAERAALRAEEAAASRPNIIQVENTTVMQKMVLTAKEYADKCQAIFEKILKK